MQDLLDEILRQLRGAWRYRWWALAAAWAVCLAGWPVIGLQKDVYEATARVYVDTTSMLKTLLDDQIVEFSLDEQLRYVREAMLGTVQLERVARDSGLIKGQLSESELRDVILELRDSVQVTSLNDALPRGVRLMRAPTDDTYTIRYSHTDRQVAVRVVTSLLGVFRADAITGTRSNSAQAAEFLREQLTVYEQRLREAEERLAAFNRENYDRLPNLQGGYFTELQTQSRELDATLKDLQLAQSRLQRIEQQLQGEVRVTETTDVDPTSLEGRLRAQQARLDELLLRFTENHPDVEAVKSTIAELKAKKEEASALLSQGDPSILSNNPVYQALQISKNEIEAEIATLQADVDVRRSRLARLHGLIDEMPEVEAELVRLNRDYDVVNERYQTLLASLEREKLSREVVANDDLEFKVIDPPAAPPKPVSPNRLLYHLAVLLAGCGAGAALAFVLSQFKQVFSSASTLAERWEFPIIGTVSRKWTAQELRHRVFAIAQFSLGFSLLGFAFLGVIYVDLLGPGIRNLF